MKSSPHPRIHDCAILLFLAFVGIVAAGTYRVPQDEPIATMYIPDKWKPQQHEEFVEATTPQDAGHLLVLPVEHRKIAESMGEAMRYIRRTGTVRVNAASMKQETATLRETPYRVVTWDATDKSEAIKIRCHVMAIEGKWLLVFFWGSPESAKKYQTDLTKILETVEPP